MGFSLGIIGLPNVGKSTLFNSLTHCSVPTSNYPFCTTSSNVGCVSVRDDRLGVLSKLIQAEEVTPTTIEFIDIAGLVKGASKGEGLGNQFLSYLYGVDGLIQIIRCFQDQNVAHVEGRVSPAQDIGVVNLELILKDLETVERRIEKITPHFKSKPKEYQAQMERLSLLKEHLQKGNLARSLQIDHSILNDLPLLSAKPLLYVANINEPKEDKLIEEVRSIALTQKAEVVVVDAKFEAELAELPEAEAEQFRRELGSGLNSLIKAGYRTLGLVTFFTIEHKRLRAWTIKEKTPIRLAAGKVHTDMEKGFIAAEVIPFSSIGEANSIAEVKERGKCHQVGREYIVQDGDVLTFKFSL